MVSKLKIILSFSITAVALVVLFLFAVNTGSLKVTPIELFKGLFISYNENVATIFDLRFPRIFIAILGVAATAVSGVLLQAVMKNPLADPGSQFNCCINYSFCSCFVLFYPFICVFGRHAGFYSRIQFVLERRTFTGTYYFGRCSNRSHAFRYYERI